MRQTIYEDFKYSMQDTNRIYVGSKYTFRELLDEEELLFNLHHAGHTVVLITHDNSIAVQAQRIIRLEDGRVVYDGPADAPDAVVTPRTPGKRGGGDI